MTDPITNTTDTETQNKRRMEAEVEKKAREAKEAVTTEHQNKSTEHKEQTG